MITLAGTEPSTLFGMSEVLGVDSPDARNLQQQMVTRMAIMSDPDAVLPDNPALRDSIRATDEVASRVIKSTAGTVTDSVQDAATDRRNAAIRDIVLVLGALAIALVTAYLMALSLVQPLRVLRDSALKIAHAELEHGIARVRAGDEREPTPLPVYTTDEIGQVAHAVDELHAKALLLAGDEARLRLLVNDMFETMSRRNRSLVDQQLSLIDRLERNEDDPDRLDSLFRLDHLAARMRRNGANLLVLAGAQLSHERGRAVPLSTVISAATSEVEDYRRVETGMLPDVTVTGLAAGDTVHLLAELIDNALRYSPPTAPVRVSAEAAADAGALIEIVDTGLGMTDTDLRMVNMRLEAGGEVTPENARRMGLFVVTRLAHRHGIRVRLSGLSGGGQQGIMAEVYLPPRLLLGGTGVDQPEPRRIPDVTMPPVSQWAVREGPEAALAPEAEQRNGSDASEPTVSLLPRRSPGSSGIGVPPAGGERPAAASRPGNTSAYFSSRKRVEPGEPSQPAPEPAAPEVPAPPARAEADALGETSATPPADATADDLIYQRMLSDWLVDPHELARSGDLDWKSVWDHGWSVAAEVEKVPVASHTEQGLPVREPGVRLVPGSPGSPGSPGPDTPGRDPDAVRASISSHLGGVHAARSHARETRPENGQEPDHE